MPVTTRAAALRSQANADLIHSQDQATPTSTSTGKTTRKCSSKQQCKQALVQQIISCAESQICPPLQPQSTTLDAVLTPECIHEQPHEDVILKTDDATVEPTSSTPITGSVSPTKSPPTKNDDNDSIISLESSNNDENEIFAGDSSHLMNVPVIKGEITTGTSTRGGKMVFMNGFAYLYMSMAKETTGWRCARRNENCKAVIHISKQTGQFSHWNGIFHCHSSDARETRKRDILNKIKHRVLDEYISIKIIIEEEYRKANLSVEEKRMMPLPAQIESGLHKLRRKSLPPMPQNQKFLVPSVYQETYSHQKFLIYDKRKTIYGGRLMIFASDEQLNVLYGSDVLFADGTFKVSSKLFEQLYVLHGMQNGEAIPVCFILTSNRKQETYEAIFRCLKRIGGKKGIDLKPTTIVCDFERAFMNAVQTEMNVATRFIWLILNLFFGAGLACILFNWVACDMKMPLILTNFISTYLPILSSLFNVPYVHINEISSSVIAKLIFNAFLYAIFGFIHTLFAQEYAQAFLGQFLFPKQTLRTVYCLLVTITAFIIMGFWQHTHIQLWNLLPSTMNDYQQNLALFIIYNIIFAPGWYVIIKFNPFEFCGLQQIFSKFDSMTCPYSSSIKSETRTTGNQTLVTTGLFRYCRHPLYLITLLAFTITPTMSLDRLAFILYTCIYASIGIPFEERKLIQIFGQDYVNYQQHVPAIFPCFISKMKQN
ncbi:unnamed protein product [Rotaria sp. Silwood1]|nr:unnamed protein product [Rotaria sp. Silwood1]